MSSEIAPDMELIQPGGIFEAKRTDTK